MEAKDRVYQALCRMSKSDCQITAAALAEELNLSRQVVSHYLNRLLEEGCVEKTLTRPVCWNIRKQQRENVQGSVSEERKEIEEVLPEVRREDVFDAMIGADGSQKNVIERCKAAVISFWTRFTGCLMKTRKSFLFSWTQEDIGRLVTKTGKQRR